MKRKGLQVFTHHEGDMREDWSLTYPYTIVGYQFGKRVYREETDPREVREQIEDPQTYSPSLVIVPNGDHYTREQFIEAYDIAVGLIVPDSNVNKRTVNNLTELYDEALRRLPAPQADNEVVIIDEEGTHYGRIEGNTLRRREDT